MTAISYTYNLATGTWTTPSGTAGTDWLPSLDFGTQPTWAITATGSLPPGFSSASTWCLAVARDWLSATTPMCRTSDGVEVAQTSGGIAITAPLDTLTERFLRVVDGVGEGVRCWMQVVGMDSSGTPCCMVTLPLLCRPALDPHGPAGPLPPIPTTNMTEAEVEAIAEDAAEAAVEGELANYYTKTEADNLLDGKISTDEKGAANGVATLRADGKLTNLQVPVGNGNFGLGFKQSYDVRIYKAEESEISSRSQDYKPIVPSNLNTAVTAALSDANHITLTPAQQQTARGVLGIDGTTSITALTGGSGTVEPGKVYTLTMTTDFTLSASSVASGIYGESVLFVVPGSYAFSVASGITLDADMSSGNRYRLLISWTPYGVHVEQTAEWEAPAPSGQVTLTFSGTVPTGAGWTIDGQTYTSGQTATLSPGTYAITYASVTGYDSPSTPTSVTVAAGDTLTLTAEYTESQSSADYTVSGASIAAANGGYNLDSSKTNSGGGPVCKNANGWYLNYAYDTDAETRYWVVCDSFFNEGDFSQKTIAAQASGNGLEVPTSGWSGGVTVTQGN